MSARRKFLKCEIADAAEYAALYNLRVVMHPSGELEMAPARSAREIALNELSAADRALLEWQRNVERTPGIRRVRPKS